MQYDSAVSIADGLGGASRDQLPSNTFERILLPMECQARIIREQKRIGHLPGQKPVVYVQFYCPVLGDLVLKGEQAERVLERVNKVRSERSGG